MSVTSIRNAPGKSGNFGKRTDSDAERAWIAITNGFNDTEFTVRNHGQGVGTFPIPYQDSHPESGDLLCTSLSVRQDRQHPLKWDVVAKYSSRPTSELDLQAQEAPNPLTRQAEISWQTVQYQEPGIRDLDNKGFCNSAGDPFDPPVEYQRSRWVITISKNVSAVPNWLPDYENAVNNDVFSVEGVAFAQYSLRLSGISISAVKREKVAAGIEFFYRVVSFRLEHNRDKWHPFRVLDQGFRYKSGSNRISITEDNTVANSRPITTPALLDGFGTRLVPATAENAKFVEFQVYPLKPFNGFVPTT